MPDKLRAVVEHDLKYNHAIAELTKYSLVRQHEGFLSIHNLMQEVIRDSLKKEQSKWRNLCVKLLNELRFTDFSTAEFRALFLILAPHIEAVTDGISHEDETEEIAFLFHFLGLGFDELADYSTALKWYEKDLAISEKVLGCDHPVTVATYNSIADVYYSQGYYDRALELLEKALAIREKVLGDESPDIATTYNSLAHVIEAKGNYCEAMGYLEKAKAIQEKVFGEEHPTTSATYNIIAWGYYKQGNYDLALQYYRKALDISEKVLGEAHPDTAAIYDNIAGVYRAQGNYDLALEYYRESYPVLVRALGLEHQWTKTGYNNMAIAYEKSRKPEPFVTWLKKLTGTIRMNMFVFY